MFNSKYPNNVLAIGLPSDLVLSFLVVLFLMPDPGIAPYLLGSVE